MSQMVAYLANNLKLVSLNVSYQKLLHSWWFKVIQSDLKRLLRLEDALSLQLCIKPFAFSLEYPLTTFLRPWKKRQHPTLRDFESLCLRKEKFVLPNLHNFDEKSKNKENEDPKRRDITQVHKKGSIINSEFVLSSALLFFLTLVGVCLFKHELISVIKQGWTTLSIREPHVIKIIRPIIYSIRMQAFTTRVLIEHIHKENLPYQPYIT